MKSWLVEHVPCGYLYVSAGKLSLPYKSMFYSGKIYHTYFFKYNMVSES